MEQPLYHVLFNLIPTLAPFKNASMLCLHEYFGGRQKINMGGVCLLGTDGKRQLQFPYNYKAPQFTKDYYGRPNLAILAALPALETFCRAKCWCDLDTEQEERDKATQKLQAQVDELANKALRPMRLQHHRPGYSPSSLKHVLQWGPLSPRKKISKPIHPLPCSLSERKL